MKDRKRWISVLAGVMAVLILVGLLAGLLATPAQAASSSELKEQLDAMKQDQKELENKIDELENKVSENMNEMEKLVAEKSAIDQQIGLLYQQIAGLNEQISTYGLLIADIQEDVDAAEARLAELTEKNRERIRAMEENGSVSYWSVLFQANSFSDLLDRLNMIEEIASADRRRLQEMREAAKLVEQAKETLEVEKSALVEKKQEAADSQAVLEKKRGETDSLLIQLNALGEEYEAYIEEQEKEMQALSQQISEKKNEYDEAKESEYWKAYWATYVPPTTAPPDTKPSSSGSQVPPASLVDGLVWITPINFRKVTSPYGMRIHPIHGDWRFHGGVDLAASQGTDIVASRGGKVVTATYNHGGYGYYVVIDHGDGFRTLYAHMTHYIVGVGDTVAAGEKIGECGSTGASTGPHLHFEVHYNGATQNPLSYIKV